MHPDLASQFGRGESKEQRLPLEDIAQLGQSEKTSG